MPKADASLHTRGLEGEWHFANTPGGGQRRCNRLSSAAPTASVWSPALCDVFGGRGLLPDRSSLPGTLSSAQSALVLASAFGFPFVGFPFDDH